MKPVQSSDSLLKEIVRKHAILQRVMESSPWAKRTIEGMKAVLAARLVEHQEALKRERAA